MYEERIKVGMYDSNENINHNSWTIGGTHITNFGIDQLMKYKNTIDDYKKIKPEENLVISGFAYNCDGNPISSYSLHCIGEFGSLDEFWRIFKGN
jgi:hypothetical protein